MDYPWIVHGYILAPRALHQGPCPKSPVDFCSKKSKWLVGFLDPRWPWELIQTAGTTQVGPKFEGHTALWAHSTKKPLSQLFHHCDDTRVFRCCFLLFICYFCWFVIIPVFLLFGLVYFFLGLICGSKIQRKHFQNI